MSFNDCTEVHFNTPKNINFELLFSDLKPKDLIKIQFLIHQINFFTRKESNGYQLHIKNHSGFLGIKDGELTAILTRLVDNGIIKVTSKGSKKSQRSNTYAMVEHYGINESNTHTYQVSKYQFLKKWIADGYIVKAKKDSAYVKADNTASHDAGLIAENIRLKAEIESLKAEIARLSSESSTSTVEPVMNPEPEPDSDLQIYSIPDDPDCDFITFNYRGTLGCIMNYSDMAYWFDSLSEAKKHQVIIGIINGDYHINEHTVVDMEKVDNPEDAFMFNYWGINTLTTV